MTTQRRQRNRWAIIAALSLLTALASYAVGSRLHLDPNVASLLPQRGESAALRRYLRAFGGSDLVVVLVTHQTGGGAQARSEVSEVADRLTSELAALETVRFAASRMDTSRKLEPMLVWRHADAAARARLARALSSEGMRQRLKASRTMLLAPGAAAASEMIARDPLRLAQLLKDEGGVDSGFVAQADGAFTTDDGLAHLVLVFPEGQALRGADAKAFMRQARRVISEQQRAHPGLEIGITGGHAIAEATEAMLVRDLTLSGSVSMLLAMLAFALTFRRLRALWAIMPPLLLGTVWTAAIAAMMPTGLSAIAVAFMSVVVGVGVDTGVHVYAALLEARRDGLGPDEAARVARQKTQRPVMVAAITAGAAFGSLALSEIGALRQLGILCAGGEILTALAIVVVTPVIGAWLERKPPPPLRPPRWTDAAAWLTATRGRAAVCLGLAAVPLFAVVALGMVPQLSDAIVAMRPKKLEPLAVQERVYEAFGGRAGQWVVLVADTTRERAHERVDRIAERLAGKKMAAHVEAVDAISSLLPAKNTQRARFAARDALDLPNKADELERALEEQGFATARFASVLDAMRRPPAKLLDYETMQKGDGAIMLSRYFGSDGGEAVAVVYVLPRPGDGHAAAVEAAVREADPAAMVTGYSRLDSSLRASLEADLPRIGLVAALLVILALAAALRRVRDVVLAAAVVAAEIGVVLFLIRVLKIPLHAYDALVLPVLLGITVDEGMFLLFRARALEQSGADVVRQTLRDEGPPIATTALTTAAGFAGLLLCDFDGLRHLGMVGAVGSVAGLVVALLVVPAGLRLAGGRSG